jgi:hypothetical protein
MVLSAVSVSQNKGQNIKKMVSLLCKGPWKKLDEAKNPLNENDI